MESPTKARTIRRFLPPEYQVEASMGHVRDLPASAAEIPKDLKGKTWARLGVDVERGFKPLYVVSTRKKNVVSNLRSALKQADELYIATDEDREGESIGWHLVEVLKPDVPVKRMVFHEITEDAIRGALDSTRDIDVHLVDAQETRRVLDRLVGYSISPLLWKKIAPKLSAGRVQSVAVRLLVLREKERMRFTPATYWDLQARLRKDASAFGAVLTHLDGVRLAGGRDFDADTGRLKEGVEAGRDVLLLGEADARRLAEQARVAPWQVASVEERSATRSPSAPFTTSTLQQEASRKLGLAAKDTMRVAQELYENGYITYMRTDSTHLSQEAVEGSREAIERRYGSDYLSPRPRQFKGTARNAQEAHEAIRPAGRAMPTAEEHGLKGVQAALYELVWKRTLATQMADARLKFVTARITASTQQGEASFRASGRTILFPGFFRAYVEGSDDPEAALDDREQPLPELARGDALIADGVDAEGHETKPPARFTEASLVKLLEGEGIGRPSTYASIIDTIMRRGYARKNGSQLVPTFTAFATNNLLERQFAQLVDTEFTANMEAALDDIATGTLASTPYLRDFFLGAGGIESRVSEGLEGIDAREISTIESERWEPYVVRVGRYGPYVEGPVEEGELKTASLPDELAPGDVTREMLEQHLREGNKGDVVVGEHPDTGLPMLLKRGPYGPYLQLGEDPPDKKKADKKSKPKRVSLPPGVAPHDVHAELAMRLLAMPAAIGEHPETGKPVEVGVGRYGPYVRHQGVYASVPKDTFVLDVTLEQALELLRKKAARNKPLRTLGEHPETGAAVEVRDGRYGPYVKSGKLNASLPNDLSPDDISMEQAVELLAARAAKTGKSAGGARRGKTAGAKGKGGKAKGKTAARGKGKKKTSAAEDRPKAGKADLERFLNELDPQVAEVVARVEGMEGREPQPHDEVGRALAVSPEEVARLHKRGMFKLRMAFGKSRSQEPQAERA
ncbi:MAG: type I DNA topoisomerase [Deinococcales bacterium]